MGYSIYVAAPNKATMEEMYRFLRKHYSAFTGRMDKVRYHSEGRGRKELGGLDYIDKSVEFPVGFDYNCMCGPERVYMWAVVEWMAWTLFPDNPEYWYDSEEKFPVKESPIRVEYFRDKLKKDMVIDKGDIKDFAEEMYWDLRVLDAAWKVRSGVADPIDFWEAVEEDKDWWDTYQEDHGADYPTPFAEDMQDFFQKAPLDVVKQWVCLAHDTCPDHEELKHWLEQLIGEAVPYNPFKYGSAKFVRMERRRDALYKALEKHTGEEVQ